MALVISTRSPEDRVILPPVDSLEEERRKLWENILSTDSDAGFREFTIDQLDLRPSDSVLSVGCGAGSEPETLAKHITGEGHSTGIGVYETVLTTARARCDEFPHVPFKRGDITDLPVPDASSDSVNAEQVLSEISASPRR